VTPVDDPAALSAPTADSGRAAANVDPRTAQLARLGAQVGEIADELWMPLQLVLGGLDQLASRLDRMSGAALAADAAQADALVRLCREGIRRIADLVEQVGAHGRGLVAEPVANSVDICRLVRVTVDVVARALARPPSITLDLPELPPMRTDEQILGLLVAHVVRYVAAETSDRPDATVEVGVRAGRRGDDVEISVVGRGRREGRGRFAFEMGLASDLVDALRGDLDVMAVDDDATAVFMRIPVMS
jgi:hypothetical protein